MEIFCCQYFGGTWGVDDFDESYPLPYTNDLVRLATSMKIVVDVGGLSVKPKEGCDAILEGYRKSLKEESFPIQDEPEGGGSFQHKMSLERVAC